MNLVLIEDMGKYVVKSLNDEFEFVHNKADGSNWFNQKTLASMFGVNQSIVSRRLRTYLKHYNKSKSFMQKRLKHCIKLKTEDSTQPVKFYNFKAVSYLAHTLKTPEAFDMLEWIDSSLNTMFNVVTGQLDIDTNFNKMEVLV